MDRQPDDKNKKHDAEGHQATTNRLVMSDPARHQKKSTKVHDQTEDQCYDVSYEIFAVSTSDYSSKPLCL